MTQTDQTDVSTDDPGAPRATYDFLIVGGGMVADAAAKAIREQGAQGSIGILGDEPTTPYPRPALSKKLWTDPDFSYDDGEPSTAEETGAEIHLETRVVGLDPDAHEVTTEAGDRFGYGSLLIATGGHPTTLDGLPAGDRVLYYRTLSDYHRLRGLVPEGEGDKPHVAVVGGGYIGSEIAAAMVGEGCRVTLLHPDEVLGESVYPREFAERYQQLFTDAGIDVRGGSKVAGGLEAGDGVQLQLDGGETVEADVVVLGLGIQPSGDPISDALDRADDGGIVVDERLATSAPDVYAAGDVAQYPDPILGRRRVEHVDNADSQGATVGRIMAGSDEAYDHTPMFYSDLFGHGYEAMGTLDASLETVVDDFEDGDGGQSTVLYYLSDDEVVGVLLWDCAGGLDEAEQLLAAHTRPADASELVGRIRPQKNDEDS
ncbi:NAD(P)/FAD-dependent oxidoreductase [Nocardioides litoris]|uniref:NAD(P)/FAD-dependent oxidoreductase n=1 Tax=Nocardioides litoris TaxID=1926648 RepID=UPI00248237E8|nr:FAD/NAD(P)-binding oxidoreductase [Nocardioides litoris]